MSRAIFNKTPISKPRRNRFDLGHDVKFSCEMGTLVPTLVQEVLPGDKFRIRSENLIRFSPLLAPVMHNIRVFTHYFFVPNRIIWPNWEKFISPDLSKESPPAAPYLVQGENFQFEKGSLGDYLGLPTDVNFDTDGGIGFVSALPFAAYAMIYNEYYRDQNLQNKLSFGHGDDQPLLANGSNSPDTDFPFTAAALPRRAWQHDYFTAALPFAQKGPAVELPLGTFDDVPVISDDLGQPYQRTIWKRSDGGMWNAGNDAEIRTEEFLPNNATTHDDLGQQIWTDPEDNMWKAKTSDLQAGVATINDLRVAMRLQEWFEKAARGGSRYVEQLMVHWNVRSDDARLNRPEFLGGTRNPVIISEVLQTSETADTPQATMAGHGISASSGKSCHYYAKEHGYIIGIMSVTPATAYQQGIPRHFLRQSWEDYAWPTFAHLGEQEIMNKEVYYAGNAADAETFGYIPRFSEYRYTPSRVAGEFRDSLAFWHLGRIFGNRPTLSAEFIECRPRSDIFAVPESEHLWCHTYHDVKVSRSLPRYGVPTL